MWDSCVGGPQYFPYYSYRRKATEQGFFCSRLNPYRVYPVKIEALEVHGDKPGITLEENTVDEQFDKFD